MGRVGLGAVVLSLMPYVGVGVAVAEPEPAGAKWASVHEKRATLLKGCHHYRYDYEMTPGPQGGTLELRLVGPSGRGLAGAYFDTSSDPARGHGSWLLCSASLRPGVYKIHVEVTQRIDQFTSRTARAKTASFRLTPRKDRPYR